MRFKSTLITLLIIFTTICVYNLYWSAVQFNMDKKRKTLTSACDEIKNKPLDQRTEEDLAQLEECEAYFGLDEGGDNKDAIRYEKSIENSFSLGLDLQGGMFVTLEVAIQDLLRQLAGTSRNDSSFVKAMRIAEDKATRQQRSFVDLFVESLKETDPNANLGAIFANVPKRIGASSPEAEVVTMLKQEEEDAINRTYEIMRNRIDQFGVTAPNLQRQGITGRILLELPGVREPERVRKLLRSTARLEFWETYTVQEAFPKINDLNEALKKVAGLVKEEAADTAKAVAANDSTANDADSAIADATDTANVEESLSDEEQLRKFRRENPLFAVLSPPGNNIDPNSPVVGYSLDVDTAEVNKFMHMPVAKSIIPDNMRFAWTFKPMQERSNVFMLIALKANSQDSAALDGGVVTDARQDFDQIGRSVVSMEMNSTGAQEWGRITEANVKRCVAITLDGAVYSYPVVNEKISGGRSQISGDFDIKEAKDLATVLKAGQLPVGARITSEDLVGPSLGEDNIRKGGLSFIIAIIAVMLFMGLYYAKAGMTANVALFANMAFILGCFAAFTVVLTLPGIAAVVLTIGMAVDANVLIFERVREEIRHGKTQKAAIKAGFANAFSTIMDSNITTFLTGLVLFIFGIGPIRGFAVALMIGILTSLISALVINRLILDWYANRGKEMTFGFKSTLNWLTGITVRMVERRKTFYMISGAMIVASLISIVAVGFKTGVDFDGGRQFVIEFTRDGQPAPINNQELGQIRNELTQAFGGNMPVIKTLRADHQLQITTGYKAKDSNAGDEVLALLNTGLDKQAGGRSHTVISSIMVDPTLSNDIRRSAFYSVLFSLIIIFLYILIRFRRWQFSLGAVIALFHDVLITLGVLSFLSLFNVPIDVEFNQVIVAALLTIIGYSINDTVVVFDRIRENYEEMKSASLSEIFTASTDQTLTRTILTGGTTLVAVLVMLFLGGDVISGFMFSMTIGILVGTFSSIFVASAVAYDLIQREGKKRSTETPASGKLASGNA